jgi:hypothetical protein
MNPGVIIQSGAKKRKGYQSPLSLAWMQGVIQANGVALVSHQKKRQNYVRVIRTARRV